MGIDFRKTGHVLFFVVFLPAVSYGAGWAFAQAFPALPFWVEGISPLAAYGLLYGGFDRYAWHWPVFRWLGIVAAPDVRGRWLGEQVSSYQGVDGKHRKSRVIMEVAQTFSNITVATYYKNWRTTHAISSFIEADGVCTLFVMFETEPGVEYAGDAAAHKGVVRLVKQPDGILVGTYFNASGYHGELSFRRTTYELHHTFESVVASQTLST